MRVQANRVRLSCDIDLSPYSYLHKGEKGTIVRKGDAHTDVLMDQFHTGLVQWGNEAPLSEEQVSGLIPLCPGRVGTILRHSAIVAVCVFALKGLVGLVVPSTAIDLEGALEQGVSWFYSELYQKGSMVPSRTSWARSTSSQRCAPLCPSST